MAADESRQIRRPHSSPKSLRMLFMARPSAAPRTAAISSASALLSAMVAYVVLHTLSTWPPHMRAPPVVDLRVRTQPAQSLSDQTSIRVAFFCHP